MHDILQKTNDLRFVACAACRVEVAKQRGVKLGQKGGDLLVLNCDRWILVTFLGIYPLVMSK